MTALTLILAAACVPATDAQAQTPVDTGLVLWLKADGDVLKPGDVQAGNTEPVAKWLDMLTPSNSIPNDLRESTPAEPLPTFLNNATDNINGLPVVRFNGGGRAPATFSRRTTTLT